MRLGQLLAALWIATAACQAHSDTEMKDAEHAAVLAVTTAVFAAIRAKDTNAMQALVWGRYVFLLNDEVSHCGTNHVDLVRVEGAWKVTNWTWSVETAGCPETP